MIRSRRTFLRGLARAGAAGALLPAGHVTARGSSASAIGGDLDGDVEGIVRLLEETPREKCFEMAAEQLRRGLSYRQFLAALFLAGVRNVNPQPPGFKFHCVFVINSAHQLGLDAPVSERLLPLFWALDNFKSAQAQDAREGDFRLRPVSRPLPAPGRARAEFRAAMDAWDAERAQAAIVALGRSGGAIEVIEALWPYGARDFRNIGHKAIAVANSWRTLQTIGWRHAEPALQSLVLGLLDFGMSGRLQGYAFEDQSYLSNVERVRKSLAGLPGDWSAAGSDPAVARSLLDAMRAGAPDDACATALAALSSGKARADALWDAVHLAGGELMMRQPGIIGVHTVTSANALRYAYDTTGDPSTRLLLALQGVGWMCQFKRSMSSGNNRLADASITDLPPNDSVAGPVEGLDEIFADLAGDRAAAARKAFRFAEKRPDPQAFTARARRLIFAKATEAHDFKYAAAIFEDYHRVSAEWRPHMLATAVYHLKGSGHPDSAVMTRAREALRGA